MPTGVYQRTENHLTLCSRAGIASSQSKQRAEADYIRGRAWFICVGCGNVTESLLSRVRLYCDKRCMVNTLHSDSYGVIHKRVRTTYGTPLECENCGTTESKKFEWANITGILELARENWRRLCCQCHRRFDFGTKNKIEII